MKFALVSLGLPPSQSGQSLVLYHLLKDLKPDQYSLITQKNFHLYGSQGNGSSHLPGTYHYINPDYQVIRGILRFASTARSTGVLSALLKVRIHQLRRIIRQERSEAVIACTGDLFDPPAAYQVSKSLDIPYILYAFDHYSHQWMPPLLHAFARKHEEQLILGAAEIIVPNEFLRREYRRTYDVEATVLHNPCELSRYQANPEHNRANNEKEITILYTGAIYEAHYDAFQNLIQALHTLDRPEVRLHIYTPQSESRLRANNISGEYVTYHKNQPIFMMPEIQQRADILFLPLAFNSPYPEIVKTASPGKIGELLAAKRPVLVHAPADSFVSWYFNQHSCGLVVSENDPVELAKGIERLVSDQNLQQSLGMAAYARAKEDFDDRVIKERFTNLLGAHCIR
ncbi:MAG: glycosyltransferase family 4 protein [Clostridiaceae bacterium]|jgi:glycosyltransferase involved in cell wall biosynthesis|nr:glycosyltransferase family 4 protein [Clostridiaceae bacterium]HNS82620.1 glycosyltransferase [Methanolinea sp.]